MNICGSLSCEATRWYDLSVGPVITFLSPAFSSVTTSNKPFWVWANSQTYQFGHMILLIWPLTNHFSNITRTMIPPPYWLVNDYLDECYLRRIIHLGERQQQSPDDSPYKSSVMVLGLVLVWSGQLYRTPRWKIPISICAHCCTISPINIWELCNLNCQ